MRLPKKNLTRLILTTLFCTASAYPAIAVSVGELAQNPDGSTAPVDATLQTDDSDTVTGRLTAVNGSVARIEQDNGNVEYVNLPTRREVQQFNSFIGDRVTVRGRNGGTISVARAPQVIATAPVASTGSSVSQPETIQPSSSQTTQTQTETQTTQTQPVETDPAETQPTQPQSVPTQPDNTIDTQPTETQPSQTQPVETQPTDTQPTDTQPQSTTEPVETNEPVRGLW